MDSDLVKPIHKLYQLKLYGRWLFVILVWLLLGSWSLWQFRQDFALIQDHFTWVAIRYGLAFQLLPTFGLFFCIGLTGSTLVWQSSHLIWGISPKEMLRLEVEVKRIQAEGPRHPFWKWIFK